MLSCLLAQIQTAMARVGIFGIIDPCSLPVSIPHSKRKSELEWHKNIMAEKKSSMKSYKYNMNKECVKIGKG